MSDLEEKEKYLICSYCLAVRQTLIMCRMMKTKLTLQEEADYRQHLKYEHRISPYDLKE